ncbi:MAG: dephospho-CoA kinase [Phycisphaerae bacterium]|nr:dephospho-CoA kinase [Phycisphaerae bacterium]
MQKTNRKIIGLLGGVASGKSTVAAELAKLGCAVIDADVIAKQLLGDEDIKKQIRHTFGSEVFDDQGRIDKKKLAQKAFENTETVKAINAIIHPPVLLKIEELISRYQLQPVEAIVLDVPLLAEVGWDTKCDKLIFIECDSRTRLKRAQKRGIFDENELKKRENFQISLDKKQKMANYIIENNNLSMLIDQIRELFPALVS